MYPQGDTTIPYGKVQLIIGGHVAECRVGLVPALAYPIVLGWDWLWFQEILQDWSHPCREEEILVPLRKEFLGQEQ